MVSASCGIHSEAFEVHEATVTVSGHTVVNAILRLNSCSAGEGLKVEVVKLVLSEIYLCCDP